MEQQTLLLLIKSIIGIVILLMVVFGALAFFKRHKEKKQKLKKQLQKKKNTIKKESASSRKSSSSNSQKENNSLDKKSSPEKSSVKVLNETENSSENSSENRSIGIGETILVVDDSSTARKILEKNLSEKNYQIESAVDGQEALHKIKKSRPDLIITDIEMPKMDGFGLLKNIRGNLSTSGIPVIMITANLDVDIEIGEKNGANGFLRKPYNKDDLTEQVEFLLNFN